MPYYRWSGIDIEGRSYKGKLAAQSSKHLDECLFKRGIALTKSKSIRLPLFARLISLPAKIHLFKQLAVLVDAGVLLPNALSIVADQIKHPRLQDITCGLADLVHSGMALGAAMRRYSAIFDPLVIQIITIGQESSNMGYALHAVSTFLEKQHDFKRQLRSALAIPMLTGSFLLLISGVIFGVILPRFVTVFASLQHEVPPLTQFLLDVSNFVHSWRMVAAIIAIGTVGALIRKYLRSTSGSRVRDWLYLTMPFIGLIMKNRAMGHMLQSLGLLLNGGMLLVPALRVVGNTGDNTQMKKQLARLHDEVAAGSALSHAMARMQPEGFSQESIAMVRVGEESGNLGPMLEKAADLYHDAMGQHLRVLIFVVQPLGILLLGLLVALLIFAVYVPIINLSQII